MSDDIARIARGLSSALNMTGMLLFVAGAWLGAASPVSAVLLAIAGLRLCVIDVASYLKDNSHAD